MISNEEIEALEAKVLRLAAGDFLAAVAEIRDLVATKPEAVKARVLALIAPKLSGPAMAGITEAFGMGVRDSLDLLGQAPDSKEGKKTVGKVDGKNVLLTAAGQMASLSERVSSDLANAQKLTLAGVDVLTALAPLFAASSAIEREVTTAIFEAANEAVISSAVANAAAVVWEGERDACVHCLRYTGLVSFTGEFPKGLTYGKKPLDTPPACPLHPNCRCRLRVLNDPSYAETLRREADRSILRGYALPSESKKARLEATKKLLEEGVVAPKSVIKYAETAVSRGSYPMGQRPPTVTPPPPEK